MQISWQGQACFFLAFQRNKQDQTKVVIDPFDPSFVGLKMPLLEADIALVTHEHKDHNFVQGIKGDPFVIRGPGEYEVKEVFAQGIPSFHDNTQGKERGRNTIYTIEAEGLRLCHLGDIGQSELSVEQIRTIGRTDILFVPVGGIYTIGAKDAARIVSQLEPRMVIPMHYYLAGLKFKLEKVDGFLREMGVKNAQAQPKLTVKLRDLPQEETEVVVLTP